MSANEKDPEALAGADRAKITLLEGKNDCEHASGTVRDRQVRRLVNDYALSRPLAMAICEHAFSSGRQR
jgi:hypothetical protein